MAVATQYVGQCQCAGIRKNSSTSLALSSTFAVKLKFDSPARLICRQKEIRCQESRGLKVSCSVGRTPPTVAKDQYGGSNADQLSVVMKFGGSSVASAERMREVAQLIFSFPEERPIIVLSAMGKTTNNLLLAGEKAVTCGVSNASEISELSYIKQLHLKAVKELGLDSSIISVLLDELEQLLKGIAMMKELTLRTRDYLVSFGECMSTRIFAAYLNKIGAKGRQEEAGTVE